MSPLLKTGYPLVFVDIESVWTSEDADRVWNEWRSLRLIDDEGGGGGGGGSGSGITPGWYLVLTYIKLTWDMDSGDDECELYIREGLTGSVHSQTGLIFSGDQRRDASGRYVWFPNLNNTGDEYGGLHIALARLSDSSPISIVGIEDDWNMGVHDGTDFWTDAFGVKHREVTMYHEYRRDQTAVFINVPRDFIVTNYVLFDQDDIWQNSHFANFTLSNTPTESTPFQLNDFVVHLRKEYIQ